jgi:hypothetical protein
MNEADTCRTYVLPNPKASGLHVKVNAMRESQSVSGEELSALMPSILDKAFKGEQ